MDDLKISHENGDTVDALINKVSKRYGKDADLTTHQGKAHDYLVINMGYYKEGKIKMDMKDYVKKILDELPKKYQGRSITPAANHLIKVNKTTRKLGKKDSQAFYTIVEKMLFMCKRAQPDILTKLALLSTRGRDPDKDKKLSWILEYLSGTRDLVLTLESDGARTVKWWMDVAFTVHHYMKSHTGGMMSMERGALYSASSKQN